MAQWVKLLRCNLPGHPKGKGTRRARDVLLLRLPMKWSVQDIGVYTLTVTNFTATNMSLATDLKASKAYQNPLIHYAAVASLK